LRLGRLDEAISDLSKSLDISSNSSKAHLARSRAYQAKGLVDLAKQDYDKAIKLDPNLAQG